jgi:hypothetical protein
VLIKGRLHKFVANKSKMEKEEDEECQDRSESEQVCSDESKTRAETDLSEEGDEI